MPPSAPVQGFIKYHGRIVAALKVDTKVAMYTSADSAGRWVGSNVASTFHAKPWGSSLDFHKFEAELNMIAEFNRLMPESNQWGARDKQYDCLMCGAIIHDRNLHMRFHHKRDQEMLVTLEALFGGK